MEYDPASVAVVTRWQRDKERLEASVEAKKQTFNKTFADLLRQENVKRALAMDAQAATKDPNRREASRDLESLRNRSVHKGYESDEIITGMEPMPWDE